MTLQDYLVRYNISRDIKPSTLEHYQWVIHSLDSFVGHETCVEELSADLVNGYLLWLRDNGRSPFTCKQRRASLLVIWRAAAEEELAPQVKQSKVRSVRVPDPPKDVWSPDEVKLLLEASAVLGGLFRNMKIERAMYFRTLIAAAYDSGLRRSDLHALPIKSIKSRTVVTQLKTGRCVVARFSERTEEEIADFVLGRERELVWPKWSDHRGVFSRMFQKIVVAAGLTGSFSKIRKTSCTEVERLQPGVGWLHLGHSNPQTARVWYINQARAYSGNVPMPPELPLA